MACLFLWALAPWASRQTSALRAAAVEAVELPEAALLALRGPLQVGESEGVGVGDG